MGDSHPGSRPNVLLVTIDSLRADHVGCYGHDRDTTPTIDRLAERGARFTNAFAHACSTRPSFPSILTAVYPTMYGGYERVSAEQTVVSEAFSAAGYRTAGFHSNLYLGAEFGYDRGFDAFFDSKEDGPSDGNATGGAAGVAEAVADRLPRDGVVYRTLARLHDAAIDRFGGGLDSAYVVADDLTDLAIEWVESEGSTPESPRFLWVHYMDAHHPYLPPARHQRALGNEVVSDRRAMVLRRKMLDDPDAVTEVELATLCDLYDAEIRFVDTELDRLLDAVRGSWGETTVAVTADHGEEFREHGGFSHRATFHDELLHVPLVVSEFGGGADDSDGGSTFAGTHDGLVGLVDLAPTLLAHAGIESPESYRGYDLGRLADVDDEREHDVGDGDHGIDDGEWPRDAVLGDWVDLDTGERRFAYRDHEWKLIRRESGDRLYHLPTDPGETENLADREPAVVERLGAVLDEHEREIEATRIDVGEVEMDESVKRRLRELGYQE